MSGHSRLPNRDIAARELRLNVAQLYVLLDGQRDGRTFCDLATGLVRSGVHILQLRDKSLGDRELLKRARLLREITLDTDTLFIMNDRPDLGRLSEADGVHVGQEELSVQDTRQIAGPRRLVGVSTHSIEQVRKAIADGADYIGCGPTFPSATKEFASFPGIPFLEEVAREVPLPAFAIGGIDKSNLEVVFRTGFRRIAIGNSVVGSDDPVARVGEILQSMEDLSMEDTGK